MDSTIIETVTATPSGGSGLECSDTPNLVNPDFEAAAWPGAWYPSNSVTIADGVGIPQQADIVAEFHNEGVLEQALIVASSRTYNITFSHRQTTQSFSVVTISFGSYDSATLSFPAGQSPWFSDSVTLRLDGSSGCLPVVFSIKVTLENDVQEDLRPKVLQIDNIVITPVSDT